MFEDINLHRAAVANHIAKSFINDFGSEDEFEKANHKVGDVHPNGKWVWKEYAPGKFDWRGIKGGASSGGSSAGQASASQTNQQSQQAAPAQQSNKSESKSIEDIPDDKFKQITRFLEKKNPESSYDQRHLEDMTDEELDMFSTVAEHFRFNGKLSDSVRKNVNKWANIVREEQLNRRKQASKGKQSNKPALQVSSANFNYLKNQIRQENVLGKIVLLDIKKQNGKFEAVSITTIKSSTAFERKTNWESTDGQHWTSVSREKIRAGSYKLNSSDSQTTSKSQQSNKSAASTPQTKTAPTAASKTSTPTSTQDGNSAKGVDNMSNSELIEKYKLPKASVIRYTTKRGIILDEEKIALQDCEYFFSLFRKGIKKFGKPTSIEVKDVNTYDKSVDAYHSNRQDEYYYFKGKEIELKFSSGIKLNSFEEFYQIPYFG